MLLLLALAHNDQDLLAGVVKIVDYDFYEKAKLRNTKGKKFYSNCLFSRWVSNERPHV